MMTSHLTYHIIIRNILESKFLFILYVWSEIHPFLPFLAFLNFRFSLHFLPFFPFLSISSFSSFSAFSFFPSFSMYFVLLFTLPTTNLNITFLYILFCILRPHNQFPPSTLLNLFPSFIFHLQPSHSHFLIWLLNFYFIFLFFQLYYFNYLSFFFHVFFFFNPGGFKGFARGLAPSAMRSIPACASMFATGL